MSLLFIDNIQFSGLLLNEINLFILFRSQRCDSISQSSCNCAISENILVQYEVNNCPINVTKERNTQKILVFMISAYGILIFPLMVLRVARLSMDDTYENSAKLDIIFLVSVWIAFLPTFTTPLAFASWQMSR